MGSANPTPVAIITGAASGIGLALTKHLQGKGYKVFMADFSPKGPAIASSLATTSPAPSFIHTDVSSWDAQAELFKAAFAETGSIDFFAANAGIDDRENVFKHFPVDEEPQEPNLKTLDVDLNAVFFGLKLFVHYARKSQYNNRVRKMVVTSSMAGIYPFETNPQYAAAKHALIGLVRSTGPKFLRDDKITVNAVLPAFVPTGLAPPGLVDLIEKAGHLTPMSTMMKAYDAFLEDDKLSGETVEVTLDELHFREPVPYPNASQKWLNKDEGGLWSSSYDKKRAGT